MSSNIGNSFQKSPILKRMVGMVNPKSSNKARKHACRTDGSTKLNFFLWQQYTSYLKCVVVAWNLTQKFCMILISILFHCFESKQVLHIIWFCSKTTNKLTSSITLSFRAKQIWINVTIKINTKVYSSPLKVPTIGKSF